MQNSPAKSNEETNGGTSMKSDSSTSSTFKGKAGKPSETYDLGEMKVISICDMHLIVSASPKVWEVLSQGDLTCLSRYTYRDFHILSRKYDLDYDGYTPECKSFTMAGDSQYESPKPTRVMLYYFLQKYIYQCNKRSGVKAVSQPKPSPPPKTDSSRSRFPIFMENGVQKFYPDAITARHLDISDEVFKTLSREDRIMFLKERFRSVRVKNPSARQRTVLRMLTGKEELDELPTPRTAFRSDGRSFKDDGAGAFF